MKQTPQYETHVKSAGQLDAALVSGAERNRFCTVAELAETQTWVTVHYFRRREPGGECLCGQVTLP